MKDLPQEPCRELGGCPLCGGHDFYLNIGRDHWAHCEAHKTKWWLGENLYSDWREETEEEWQKNQYRLAQYRTVEPRFYQLGFCERRAKKLMEVSV